MGEDGCARNGTVRGVFLQQGHGATRQHRHDMEQGDVLGEGKPAVGLGSEGAGAGQRAQEAGSGSRH